MKIAKLRELDTAELANQTREQQEQMFRLRFQLRMGQTDGVKRLRELRKDRARMLTLLKERGVAESDIQSLAASAPQKGAKGKSAAKKGGKK